MLIYWQLSFLVIRGNCALAHVCRALAHNRILLFKTITCVSVVSILCNLPKKVKAITLQSKGHYFAKLRPLHYEAKAFTLRSKYYCLWECVFPA